MKNFSKFLKIAFLLIIICIQVNANENNIDNIISSIKKDLKDIKKLANKEKSNRHYQPYIVSTLKNKELIKLGISTLKEALLLIPNIDVSSDNVYYKSIVFRGSNPLSFGQSKLFIDGVLVNNIYFDGYSEYLDMPVELIKRIEVTRGPDNDNTAISNYAGTIHVYTYAEDMKEDKVSFIKAGSYNYKSIGFRRGFNYNGLKIYIDFYYKRDDKYVHVNDNALKSGIFDFPSYGIINSQLSKESDVSLYLRNSSLGLSLQYKKFYLKSRIYSYKQSTAFGLNYIPSEDDSYLKMPNYYLLTGYKSKYKFFDIDFKVGLNLNSVDTSSKLAPNITLPKITNPYEKVTFTNGIYGKNLAKQQNIFHLFSIKYNKIKNHDIQAQYYISQTKTTKVVSKITNRDTGIGLVDYSDTLPFFDKNAKRNTTILSIKDKFHYNNKLQFLASLTYENNSHINPIINPKFSLVYELKENNILKVLFSSSHRTPSWQELYTLNNLSRLGNKNLKPEKTKTFEISHIKHFSNESFIQTTLFHIQNKNQIHNYTPNNMYINHDKTNYLHGIEMEFKGHINSKDTLYLNFSYTDGSNTKNNKLSLVSKILAKGYYTYNISERLAFSTIVKYTGEKDRTIYDTRDNIPATTITDISLNYKSFKTKTNINLSIKNLFNKKIVYSSKPNTYKDDYPEIGRTLTLSIRKEF